jgi:hypothetical protein
MSELSPRAQVLLQQARRQATPTEEELALNRARLRLKLKAAPQVPAWKPIVTVVAIGLLSALATGLAVSRVGVTAPAVVPVATTPPPPPAQLDDRDLAAIEPTLTCRGLDTRTTQGFDQLPSRAMKGLPRCEPGVAPSVRTKLQGAGLPEPVAAIEASSDELGLEILEEARLAIDERRPFDALGKVQKHTRLYPASQFEEERLALQLIALCLAERAPDAVPRLAEFHAEFPSSTYAPRIERACGGLATGSSK